jgi:hypothetical protein
MLTMCFGNRAAAKVSPYTAATSLKKSFCWALPPRGCAA